MKDAVPNKKGLRFRSERQKFMLNALSKIVKYFTPEHYTKYRAEILALLRLPSINAEENNYFEIETPFEDNRNGFAAKADFWLRTVYMKLNDKSIEKIYTLQKCLQKQGRGVEELLILAMQIEPEKIVYAHCKEDDKKIAKEELLLSFADLGFSGSDDEIKPESVIIN